MSDVLYGKVRINGEAGQTITITTPTGQSRTITTTGQDYTDVVLAGLEEYTLSNGINSESVLLNIGDFQEIDMSTTLESATWGQIQQVIQAGTFGQIFALGDTKSFQVNNKTYTAEVVAINDGTGSAGSWYPNKTVDFICKELYETTYRYNSSKNNSGGFPSSEIKNTLNNTIYPLLPTDLKNVIIDKSHSYQSGSYSSSWSSQMTTIATKLWLPTVYEIRGTTQTYAPGETSSNNKAYTLASKIKNLNGASSATGWWLGSPHSNASASFWRVRADGSLGYDYASNASGVPVCFRIG